MPRTTNAATTSTRATSGGAFVALLRGINVGGNKKVPMKELATIATRLGYADVATYIASGNLVFRAEAEGAVIERSLEVAIAKAFGFEVEESFSIPGTSVDGVVLRHPHGARVELFRHPESITAPTGHPVDSTLRRGWFQLAFRVDDVVAAHHHVLGAGAVTVREPFLAPDGRSRVAFVVDPDGNLIELIERRPTR